MADEKKPIREISRAGALALLRANGVNHSDRSRNYELESSLSKLPGAYRDVDFVVAELCPFNGWFCRWGESKAKERGLTSWDVSHEAAPIVPQRFPCARCGGDRWEPQLYEEYASGAQRKACTECKGVGSFPVVTP